MSQTAAVPPMTLARPAAAAPRAAPEKHALRVACLTTEYPKVSHTFIRREILELERRGHAVLRVAIRDCGGALIDDADALEQQKTIHLLRLPRRRFATAMAWTLLTRPRRSCRALRMALGMSRVSERGVLRHLAYLAEAAALLRILRRRKVEHLHVHSGTHAAAVARLARCLGGPTYSMTVHGPDEFDAPRGLSLAAKVADAAVVMAVSDFAAAQIRRWIPYQAWPKVHVVRCTVGDRFFDDPTPIESAANTLLCVGRLAPQKGQLMLLDALRRLVDEGVNARLVLAGDGELRGPIEARMLELGLQNRVDITGWLDECAVRRRLQDSRALVQPSFAEGLPVVIMEAMAMARPVVATAVAGIPELVRHGENGWLVPAGNADELHRALREVMHASPDQLNTMGRAGRSAVRSRHATGAEVSKLEALFLRVAAPAAASPVERRP
jgi:glycosyltransferase involved in cell wall biosynthesis